MDAAALLADGHPHPACSHAEQAAEKALKALYVARSVYFPFVHALGHVMDGLLDAYPGLEELRVAATTLTLHEVRRATSRWAPD
ncbi:MAG: HEPN domain-containing protein [Thermaerobacter sp.]|nr:HEPN domain-containing protein [Thermaerobacter sp.]